MQGFYHQQEDSYLEVLGTYNWLLIVFIGEDSLTNSNYGPYRWVVVTSGASYKYPGPPKS